MVEWGFELGVVGVLKREEEKRRKREKNHTCGREEVVGDGG